MGIWQVGGGVTHSPSTGLGSCLRLADCTLAGVILEGQRCAVIRRLLKSPFS
jgi:hypothetical protein